MSRRRLRVSPVALFVGLALMATTLFAEDLDVPKLLDGVKAAVQDKKYGHAVADLQLVVAEVGRLRMEALKALFPSPPDGWIAEDAEGQSVAAAAMFGGGTVVKRAYKKGDDSSADLELMADAGPILAGLQMVLSNPAMVSGDNQIVTVKGRRALLEYHKDGKDGSLQIMLNAQGSMLRIAARGVTKAELVDKLGGLPDYDAIEKGIQN